MRWAAPALLIFASVILLSPVAYAAGEGHSNLFGDVSVEEPVKGDVRCAFGDVRVEEPVEGDVEAGFGDVYIDAPVSGRVEVEHGDVHLGSGASYGSLSVEGGEVYRQGEMVDRHSGVWSKIASSALIVGFPGSVEGFLKWLLGAAAFSALSMLAAVVMPSAMSGVARALEGSPGWSLLWGVLSLPAVLVISVALAISVVGAPVMVGLVAVYLAALFAGAVVVAYALGRRLLMLTGAYRAGEAIAALVGAVVISLLYLIPYFSAVLLPAVSLVGLGAIIVALFSRRASRWDLRGAYSGGHRS